MFDTITGLPVHPLVVHGVVVLLPLMALLSFLVAARPGWRRHAAWAVAGNAVVVLLTFAATESGEALRSRLGGSIAEEHEEWAENMPYLAVALLVASIVVWFVRERTGAVSVAAAVLVAVVGLGAVGLTVVTGDTGARSVWEDKIAGTSAPSD